MISGCISWAELVLSNSMISKRSLWRVTLAIMSAATSPAIRLQGLRQFLDDTQACAGVDQFKEKFWLILDFSSGMRGY